MKLASACCFAAALCAFSLDSFAAQHPDPKLRNPDYLAFAVERRGEPYVTGWMPAEAASSTGSG